MIKVTVLLSGILVLTAAAILETSEEPLIVAGCKSETELWASEDGTKFYLCLGNNQSLEQSCPENTFFISNTTLTGCIPLNDVDNKCVSHAPVQPCEGIHLSQPQYHEDPTKFYICPEKGVKPVALQCPQGAFIKQNGYMGCFPWPQWRIERGCDL